jgi:hypothetical protein
MLSWSKIGFLALLSLGCGQEKRKETPHVSPAGLTLNGGVVARQGGFTARLTWLSGDVKSEHYLTALVTFYSPTGVLASQVSGVEFVPTMPSMGHGTAMDEQVIRVTGPSEVTVEKAYLIMGGAWDIAVSATVDGVRDTVHFKVEVP